MMPLVLENTLFQKTFNTDLSLTDIFEYFQGRFTAEQIGIESLTLEERIEILLTHFTKDQILEYLTDDSRDDDD